MDIECIDLTSDSDDEEYVRLLPPSEESEESDSLAIKTENSNDLSTTMYVVPDLPEMSKKVNFDKQRENSPMNPRAKRQSSEIDIEVDVITDFDRCDSDEEVVDRYVPWKGTRQLISPPKLIPESNEQVPCTSASVMMPNLTIEELLLNERDEVPVVPVPQAHDYRQKKSQGYSDAQIHALRAVFKKTMWLNAMQTMELQVETGLPKKKIQGWFAYERKKMKRHENLKQASRSHKGLKSSLNQRESSDSRKESRSDQQRRQSEPIPSSSTFRSKPNEKRHKESKKSLDTLAQYMANVATLPVDKVMSAVVKAEKRIQHLVSLYMDEKLEMKKTLLIETTRLREMSFTTSPYSPEQDEAMKRWRKEFFDKLMRGKNEDKCEKYQCAKNQVDVWHPVIVFGKLWDVNLETAIKNFTIKSNGRTGCNTSKSEYLIPLLLRYHESHF